MKRETWLQLVLLSCSLLLCFILGEILIRFLGDTDPDGNFFFRSRRLKPYHLPTSDIKKKVEAFLAAPTSFVTYDPALGWSHRPMSKSDDGLYYLNADGIRTASSEHGISKTPSEDTLRIAIFGDSFAFGAQVSFEHTWGYYLERNLKEAGLNAEVLNFGVGGYGIDQAFLRWKKEAKSFSPHIVLCGFQPENVKRNVNLIRPVYAPKAGIPFTKPRYTLEENQLRLINVPTVSLENLIALAENIASWDLIRYEYWLDPQDYRKNLWLKSKLVALVTDTIERMDEGSAHNHKGDSFFALKEEPARLTFAIIRAFKGDVELQGERFYIVHLPHRKDLVTLLKRKPLPYAELLEKLEESSPVIHPERAMLRKARSSSIDTLFSGHYSATGNSVVAETITEFILKQHVPAH